MRASTVVVVVVVAAIAPAERSIGTENII